MIKTPIKSLAACSITLTFITFAFATTENYQKHSHDDIYIDKTFSLTESLNASESTEEPREWNGFTKEELLSKDTTEEPKIRENIRVGFVYDEATELYFKYKNTDTVTALNKAARAVNAKLKSSGSIAQFEWVLIKSTETLVTDDWRELHAIGNRIVLEQSWFKKMMVINGLDIIMNIVDPSDLGGYLGGACIFGVQPRDYKMNMEKKQPIRICHTTANAISTADQLDALAHELGHFLGAEHDRYSSSRYQQGSLNESDIHFGYVDINNAFYTDMANSAQCDNEGIECVNLPLFSNPEILYNGIPIGVSESELSPANNVKYFDHSSKDIVSLDYWATDLNISSTIEEVVVSWEDADIAESYLISNLSGRYKLRPDKDGNSRNFKTIVTEPIVTVPRYTGDITTMAIGIYGIFKNHDEVRLLPMGTAYVGARRKGAEWIGGSPIEYDIDSGQITPETTLVSLPALNQTQEINFKLSSYDSETSNDTFEISTPVGSCEDSSRNDCERVNIHQFFNFEFTGSGVDRALIITSKYSTEDWLDYFYEVTEIKLTPYDIPNSDFVTHQFRTLFIQKRLPIVVKAFNGINGAGNPINVGEFSFNIDLADVVKDSNIETIFPKENLVPGFKAQISQSDNPSIVLAKSSLDKPVLKISSFLNNLDNYSVDIEGSIMMTEIGSGAFEFDISDLALGLHKIVVDIYHKELAQIDSNQKIESGSKQVLFTQTIYFEVVETLPDLLDTNDNDNDGLSDLKEGLTDSDGDGIPDYKSASAELFTSFEPVFGFDINNNLTLINTQQLSLFSSKVSRNVRNITDAKADFDKTFLLSMNKLEKFYSNGIAEDRFFTPFTEVIGLSIENLIQLDEFYLYINKKEGYQFPENSSLRAFSPTKGWVDLTDYQAFEEYGIELRVVSVIEPTRKYGGISDGGFGEEIKSLEIRVNSLEGNFPNKFELPLMVFTQERENTVPVLNSDKVFEFTEGDAFDLVFDATDAEDDPLIYELVQYEGASVTIVSNESNSFTIQEFSISKDTTLSFYLNISDGMEATQEEITVTIKKKKEETSSPAPQPTKDSGSSGGAIHFLFILLGLLVVILRTQRLKNFKKVIDNKIIYRSI
ncbi:M12 family metallo-peptidase [Thalassotalea aquiviva]|uniref:M12 family metallo-peptidase n=1 Tax=Thalassotalea aquiviva TaxID=3242415 RepID=UPI00352B8AFC